MALVQVCRKKYFKEHRQYPTAAKKYKKKQEANDIFQHAVGDILQKYEIKQSSAKSKPQQYENTNSEIYRKELFEIDKLILDDSNKE